MRTVKSETISRQVPSLRSRWVAFRRSVAPVQLDPVAVEALDDHWAGLGLRGAVVMHRLDVLLQPLGIEFDDAAERPCGTVCDDELLTANVLYRTRSGVLHESFTLTDLYLDVTDLGWCTDDPRLVQLVAERNSR